MGDRKQRTALSLKKSAIYRNIGGGAGPGGGPSQFNCGHSMGNSVFNDGSSMDLAEVSVAGSGGKVKKSEKSGPPSGVQPSQVYDTSNIDLGKC